MRGVGWGWKGEEGSEGRLEGGMVGRLLGWGEVVCRIEGRYFELNI